MVGYGLRVLKMANGGPGGGENWELFGQIFTSSSLKKGVPPGNFWPKSQKSVLLKRMRVHVLGTFKPNRENRFLKKIAHLGTFGQNL